eukprot:2950-Chlamydomonas_euryale.AAC.2
MRVYADRSSAEAQRALQPRSEWVLTRLHSLVTHFRELQASGCFHVSTRPHTRACKYGCVPEWVGV